MPDLTMLSAREAAEAIAGRRLTVEALVAAYLDRIDRVEPEIGAWQYLDRDSAISAARRADAGPLSGPLHGLPIAVKDLIDTVDMPTTYGSGIYAHHRPASNAACVALARASGAIVLGKTVTTEFACFTPGKTANPHNAAHTPGGSSSGSAAAVAAGMIPLAFATQTAGSVIRPASFCGCVGFKPSFGVIPRAGAKLLCDSLDTIGTMARNVGDAAFFAGVLAARPGLRDVTLPTRLPRFGLYRTPMWEAADACVATALDHARAALEKAGAVVVELEVPNDHRGITSAQEAVMGFELVRALAYERLDRAAEISPRLAQQFEEGLAVDAEAYDRARTATATARDRLPAFFGECDALLTPAAPGEAPAGLAYTGNPVFNRMWTLLGTPCVTLPAIRGPQGLPIGIQLVGRNNDDIGLMACGLFAEQALREIA
ncbi:MAG: amidase [Alphaproteobacteria bacterium]|nr:amidase [Alphaproteobacteria bacterium]